MAPADQGVSGESHLGVRYTDSDNRSVRQVWYYSFEIYSQAKVEEKLMHMHRNPVRAVLATTAVKKSWSSAWWYIEGRTVGVPMVWAD